MVDDWQERKRLALQKQLLCVLIFSERGESRIPDFSKLDLESLKRVFKLEIVHL